MPHSRARKRASGISSWLSGKKKTDLPASVSEACAMAFRARARGASVAAAKLSSETPKASAMARSQAVVPSSPKGKGAAIWVAPRRVSSEWVSPRKGCARTNCVFGPTAVVLSMWRAGSRRTGPTPIAPSRPSIWSSTTSGSAPTTRSSRASVWGRTGTMQARQASSPSVKVVSMPEPE